MAGALVYAGLEVHGFDRFQRGRCEVLLRSGYGLREGSGGDCRGALVPGGGLYFSPAVASGAASASRRSWSPTSQ